MDPAPRDTSLLFRGDNLAVLREHLADASADLVYLDPPFGSGGDYAFLGDAGARDGGAPRVKAFADTWTWDAEAERAFAEVVGAGPARMAALMRAFRAVAGEGALLSYLAMMAPRLVELYRVLRRTGSLYLHCDPTASHYLKLLLDALFGGEQFRREIAWRSGWVSGYKARARNWVRNHDVVLYYVKDRAAAFVFHKELAYRPHPPGYERRGGGSNPLGVAIDDVWDEPALYSPWIKSFSTEKLGYMTQKPLALLERIVGVSSDAGAVVLDPFCGGGTTLVAAEKLGRRWIGIDTSPIAVALVRRRLSDAFGQGARYRMIDTDPDDAPTVGEAVNP